MIPQEFLVACVRVIALATAIASASLAFAGEFFEHQGVAIRGYDPVAYFTEGRPVKGSPEFAADYKGSKFLFSSIANREFPAIIAINMIVAFIIVVSNLVVDVTYAYLDPRVHLS